MEWHCAKPKVATLRSPWRQFAMSLYHWWRRRYRQHRGGRNQQAAASSDRALRKETSTWLLTSHSGTVCSDRLGLGVHGYLREERTSECHWSGDEIETRTKQTFFSSRQPWHGSQKCMATHYSVELQRTKAGRMSKHSHESANCPTGHFHTNYGAQDTDIVFRGGNTCTLASRSWAVL